jgi:hypothetical protein
MRLRKNNNDDEHIQTVVATPYGNCCTIGHCPIAHAAMALAASFQSNYILILTLPPSVANTFTYNVIIGTNATYMNNVLTLVTPINGYAATEYGPMVGLQNANSNVIFNNLINKLTI